MDGAASDLRTGLAAQMVEIHEPVRLLVVIETTPQAMELCGMSSLAFAVGVYLPLSTSTPIMVGGMVRWVADHTAKRNLSGSEAESGPGILFSSGLIAGASVIGTILAFLQLSEPTRDFLNAINVGGGIPGFSNSDLISLLLFLGLGVVLWAVATERWLAPQKA